VGFVAVEERQILSAILCSDVLSRTPDMFMYICRWRRLLLVTVGLTWYPV
jgi:hypothetical protein